MEIINTIIPIFAVIFLGALARLRGMIPDSFLKPANQLTYYLAIPAMIFNAIAKSDFHSQFDTRLLLGTVIPLLLVFILFWLAVMVLGIERRYRGTLIESAIHGNIGYIGLAVVFYYMGTEALATAGILAGFVMLTHNSLAVIALQANSVERGGSRVRFDVLIKIGRNPIILTAAAAILFSLSGFQLPVIIDRTLGIIGNLALPLALLLIGGSLSFHIRPRVLILAALVCLVKLILLPGLGLWLYLELGMSVRDLLPGLIILATPVATVSYVMATEMKGDPKLAVNVISISTAVSAVTILFWLSLADAL